jgi:hypothetical protein
MEQKAIQIPGIKKGHNYNRFRGLSVMLDGIALERYSPGHGASFLPSGFRYLIDGFPALQLPLGPIRMSRDPELRVVELPEGHFFRLVTNAELVWGIILATSFSKIGFGSPEARRILKRNDLKHTAESTRLGERPMYAELEIETATPATSVWCGLNTALTATSCEINQVVRPYNNKHVLESLGVEITEIVLIGLAIPHSCLTENLGVNVRHNRMLLKKIDNSENFSYIIGEALSVGDIRIVPESDLAKIDRYALRSIKDGIGKTTKG